MNNKFDFWIAVVIAVLAIVLFFRFTPVGINLSYKLMGGKESTWQEEAVNLEELELEYNKQVANYEKYKNSDNPTQKGWAENARQKANEIANVYNEAKNKSILNGIGE